MAMRVVASNSGLDREPAWWRNLQTNTDAQVDAAGERADVRGRLATEDEERSLWPRFREQFAGFDDYRRYTSRPIPVVVLERRSSAPGQERPMDPAGAWHRGCAGPRGRVRRVRALDPEGA